MKNQYFGDLNDFYKYCVLRALSNGGALRIGVCWMLTRDDQSCDGRRLAYLNMDSKWRGRDPEVFDWLKGRLHGGGPRNVRLIEKSNLITGAAFYAELLSDRRDERHFYFSRMFKSLEDVETIFFDPDTGLAPATQLGQAGSSKYLFYDEAAHAFERGYSLLIYQSFARQDRTAFVRGIVSKLLECTGASELFSLHTPHAVFFLIPQARHLAHISRQAAELSKVWGEALTVADHTRL